MKKFLSILLSLAVAVTAMAAFAVSASAIDLFPDAKAAKSGKEYDIMLKASTPADYKISAKKGTIELKIVHTIKSSMYVYLMTPDGEIITPTSTDAKQGNTYIRSDGHFDCYKNDSTGIYSGSATFNVVKGTYYLRFKDQNAGEVTFTATYPSAASTSENKVSYLSATLKKGATLQLGAVLSDGKEGKAEWSSSKSSVASVSSSGKITAKAKGTAVITAKVGDSTVKIQIKVTA